MEHVPLDLLNTRAPRPGEDYDAYLDAFGLLDRGFGFGELVHASSHRHRRPPRHLWPRMVPTLALALGLHARMLAAGARGLLVAAAYRPTGGADDSQHKTNAALDLDLLPEDRRLAHDFARVAAELWREHQHLKTGIGGPRPGARRVPGRRGRHPPRACATCAGAGVLAASRRGRVARPGDLPHPPARRRRALGNPWRPRPRRGVLGPMARRLRRARTARRPDRLGGRRRPAA